MPTANEIVDDLRATILASPGVSEISVDGISIKREHLLRELNYWERRAARENGNLPNSASIDLSSG